MNVKIKTITFKALAAIGVLISIYILFVIAAFFFNTRHVGDANKAQLTFKPIDQKIRSIGGKQICENGDNGKGIDNSSPWYTIYYYVPDGAGLTQSVKDVSAQNGYTLTNDVNQNDYQQQITQSPSSPTQGTSESQLSSDYLISQNQQLRVEIVRQGNVQIGCSDAKLNAENISPPSGQAILYWSLSL